VWLHHLTPQYFRDINPALFTILGLALSIFLGFRNNTCYERWWEGRRQWGELIAITRSLLRETMTLLPDDPHLQRRVVNRTVAFAHVLRNQLRGTAGDATQERLLEGEWAWVAKSRNMPAAVLQAQAKELGQLFRQGMLSDILYRLFSDKLSAMTDIQAACERLRSTPMPFAYSLLLHRTAWLFCLILPFGMVDNLGMGTPILTAILAYAFFGLDALGEELEEPFGLSANGLPLDAMVRIIEIDAAEALRDAVLPGALQPEDFLLL
jgi:putative membrane protein